MLEVKDMGIGTSLVFFAWTSKDRGVVTGVREVCRREGCEVQILPFLTVLGPGRILGTEGKAVGSRSPRLVASQLLEDPCCLHSTLCPQPSGDIPLWTHPSPE